MLKRKQCKMDTLLPADRIALQIYARTPFLVFPNPESYRKAYAEFATNLTRTNLKRVGISIEVIGYILDFTIPVFKYAELLYNVEQMHTYRGISLLLLYKKLCGPDRDAVAEQLSLYLEDLKKIESYYCTVCVAKISHNPATIIIKHDPACSPENAVLAHKVIACIYQKMMDQFFREVVLCTFNHGTT